MWVNKTTSGGECNKAGTGMVITSHMEMNRHSFKMLNNATRHWQPLNRVEQGWIALVSGATDLTSDWWMGWSKECNAMQLMTIPIDSH